MKKIKILSLLVLIFLFLGIWGCNVQEEKDSNSQEGLITAVDDSISTEELTLLDAYEYDFDDDGELESIELYTRAEKDEKGEIMWDDGQEWLLLVRDGEQKYILFNQYVQLGKIQYWVYTAGKDNDFHITTIQPGSASLLLTEYTFDKDKQAFKKKEIFNPENVNLLYNN